MIYTNEELTKIDKLQDNLIIELFSTRDKRYAIRKALSYAFELGRKESKFIDHIRSHLKSDEEVICTICKKTVAEIYNV